VFARNLIPLSKAKTLEEEAKLPYLLYLQGGPGFEVGLQGSSGFAGEIHDRGYQVSEPRVVLVDGRDYQVRRFVDTMA